MPPDARSPRPPTRPSWWIGPGFVAARAAAWIALAGVAGLMVRAEARGPSVPDNVAAYRDLVYRRDGDRRARLDLYVPRGRAPSGGRPAIVAIHGGGWCGGEKEAYAFDAARLARHGYVVAAIDYVLSGPDAPSWPANLDDAREAVRWLRRHADRYGVDPRRIAALGASAGGHLAALLGTSPGHPSATVGAVVDFYGPSDLAALVRARPETLDSVAPMLGGDPDEVPDRYQAASPARLAAPGAPPMLLIHGAGDPHVPPDQSRRMAATLAAAGVPHRLILVEGAGHGFGFLAGRWDLLPDVLEFLARVWNDKGASPTGGPPD